MGENQQKKDALLDEDVLEGVTGGGIPEPAVPVGRRLDASCPVCHMTIYDVQITEGWTTTCACGAKVVCHGGGFVLAP